MMEKILSRSVRLMFTGGLVLGAQMAGAQEVQKVEVTGSRIPSINVDGPSPITSLSAKDIKVDGATKVEDLLNNLPQVFAAQGSQISNGATGTANVSLRGLGADRTLVLVNGRRLPQGSVNSSAADLNQVPASLIKRVDVLTGGAGAVYGAGAVAGVVNFILKDDFQGVEVNANTSGFNHSNKQENVRSLVTDSGYPVPGSVGYDGKIQDFNILLGGNFDGGKGNATVYFGYKKTDAILQSARDFSACTLNPNGDGAACGGSTTNATGRIRNRATGIDYTNGDANGTARVLNPATDLYNFGPLNYYQRPSDTYSFNVQAHYDVHPSIRVYEEFNFHNYSTVAQVAPGGIFYAVPATIRYDNPLLSASWRTALGLVNPGDTASVNIGRRNIEGGGRQSSITDSSFREVLGAKGDIGNWTYNVFGQYARVNHEETSENYFASDRIRRALDVVPDANGNAICRSVQDRSDPSCVPYNLFRIGGVTQAQLDYLQADGVTVGYVEQNVVGATLGSDLGAYGIKLPTANNGVGVSFGVERRFEKKVFTPDSQQQTGNLAGAGGASLPLSGSYSVKEAFGEVRIPLVAKKPFIESLDLSGSYRYSDYSTGPTTNTYGIGLEWAVVKEAVIRGSYQSAVRAATLNELFTSQSVFLGGPTNDPCTGPNPSATAAQCANSGVSAAQYGRLEQNSTSQYNALGGGNPNVNPEKGKTITFGVALTPVKNLTLTVDYFNIKIKGLISSVDPTIALNQCLATGEPLYCSLIHRNSEGSLWTNDDGYVITALTNVGTGKTSGIDIGANYNLKIGTLGALGFTLNGTILSKLESEPVPGLGTYDCKGLYGVSCGTSNPKWRHKFRTTWDTPWNVSISGTWRHFDSVKHDSTSDFTLLNSDGPIGAFDQKLKQANYFDLNAAWSVTKGITLGGGVSNLFDQNPPLFTQAGASGASANGNTFPQVYDALGRKLYLNLSAKF